MRSMMCWKVLVQMMIYTISLVMMKMTCLEITISTKNHLMMIVTLMEMVHLWNISRPQRGHPEEGETKRNDTSGCTMYRQKGQKDKKSLLIQKWKILIH